MDNTIVVHEVGKKFRRYHPDRPRGLKEVLVRGPRWLKPVEHFWALRNINFSVAPGRMIGIIGQNGSGKSTLLRLIGDVMRPDEGYVETHGQIGALLDLAVGIHPDLTGRENAFVSGIIGGLTRQEVEKQLDSIVDFAELEEFIDNPLRTYSSGMRMRLAFAVAVHMQPEILLIDEVLAVGDIAFRQKCFGRIEQFKSEGCTIVLVSHEPSQITTLCDEALWLEGGQVMAYGSPEEVVTSYRTKMQTETRRRTPTTHPVESTSTNAELRLNQNRFGSMELKITNVRLLNQAGLPVTELDSGDALRVEIEYLAPQPIEAPIFGVAINNESNQVCCTVNTAAAALSLPTLQGEGLITLQFERLDLIGGEYFVNVGVYEKKWTYTYDYHWNVYPLLIHPTPGSKRGVLHPPYRWEVSDKQSLQETDLPVLEAP